MNLKSIAKGYRIVCTSASFVVVSIASYIYNEGFRDTILGWFLTGMIVVLFLIIVMVLSDDATEKRSNVNAAVFLIVSILSLLFAFERRELSRERMNVPRFETYTVIKTDLS